ncbi:TonB-linked outer membrane protein, SusC/RagA family [Sphingobacterium nematocida]|uniref:TonB-linked outer membrane protein, SusC/RagA family n=1 Tax=Sphingobacterium nematocida TaxID=1513896 RepID=A0A1T5BAS7_9SPHI|nr:SusC/RagA family TonB-linked outer membrane protein [Sphingobacterium nematocida]SKB43993.1 TonB-linked outer membrane protein, SusC/RagA family [Sphingobacterium nematocida]
MSKFYLKCCSLSILMLLCISVVFAQQSVTGIVSDASGPMKGVSISVKGTNKATQSDANGAYSIQADNGQTIRFSMIGYAAQEVMVASAKTINVTLINQDGALDEVVVTAMGIKREKKALGYSFQEVKSEQLLESKEANISNALVGKVAGLNVIKGSNGPASSTKITLRGNNSLTGDNQPLIIVDGVPVNNFLGATNNDYWNPGTDMGGGLGDINPEDIESMSVLKSGAASALYGSRAGNGAIIITTKSGKSQKGSGITLSSTLGLETLFMIPDIQNDFGQGNNGVADPIGTSNWGPAVASSNQQVYDNIGNFFKTGINNTQNISFQKQLGETNIYTSATYLDDQSKIPGATFRRINLLSKVGTTFGANNRWSTDVKVQYMNTNAKNRPLSGQNNSNAYATLFRMPRTLNILDYKDAVNEFGNMLWYGTSNSMNPYWLAEYKLNEDSRDRFLMNANLKYKLTDWLDAEARFGTDMYTTNFTNRTYSGSPLSSTGQYGIGKNTFNETNYIAALHAHKEELGGSKWGLNASLFGQLMRQKESSINGSAGELEVPNLFTLGNSKGNPSVSEGFYEKQINSLYATAELNYDGFWYVNLTGRNDWSSALNKDNRSYFYPSVSTSLVVTEMINKTGGSTPSWLSFLKVRGSYAAVGNDLGSYKLYNVYNIGKDPNGNTTASRGNVKFNPNVVSELIKTFEVGFDAKLFNRLGVDFSWYKTNATNQLISLPLNPLSGYSSEIVNAGNIQNKGFEIVLDANILKSENGFNWDTRVNFSKNENKIVELTENVKIYPLGGFDNIAVRAEEGYLYGNIYGSKFLRVTDENSEHYGKLLLNGSGLPQATGQEILGNQSPKALAGWTNSFSYKNIGLSFQIDGRFGGEFFSGTNVNLQANGTAAETVMNGNRDNLVVDGVIASGSSYVVNDKSVTPQQYWTQVATSGNLGIGEANIYDATNIRLRNISLNYRLPSSILKNTFIQNAKFGFTVNNVWMIKSHAKGIDPESVFAISTNATGFENFSTPTSRSYFFNLTLGF